MDGKWGTRESYHRAYISGQQHIEKSTEEMQDEPL